MMHTTRVDERIALWVVMVTRRGRKHVMVWNAEAWVLLVIRHESLVVKIVVCVLHIALSLMLVFLTRLDVVV